MLNIIDICQVVTFIYPLG